MYQPELIGTMLAHSDDTTQGEVLNAFVEVLTVICKPKEFSSVGMQAYYIAKHLRPNTVEFLRELLHDYDHLRQALPAEVAGLVEQRDGLRAELEKMKREKIDLE